MYQWRISETILFILSGYICNCVTAHNLSFQPSVNSNVEHRIRSKDEPDYLSIERYARNTVNL